MRFIIDGPSAMNWDGASASAWMAGFRILDGETLAGLLESCAQVAHRTEELAVHLPDLDAAHIHCPRRPGSNPAPAGRHARVLLHVIAETAQHADHADIIRESVGGARSMG